MLKKFKFMNKLFLYFLAIILNSFLKPIQIASRLIQRYINKTEKEICKHHNEYYKA